MMICDNIISAAVLVIMICVRAQNNVMSIYLFLTMCMAITIRTNSASKHEHQCWLQNNISWIMKRGWRKGIGSYSVEIYFSEDL